jgi:hypothetical protein
MITQKDAQEYFDYKDVVLYWKVKASNRVKVGNPAGSFDPSTGYHKIHVNYKFYKTHRVIFLYHYGYFPDFIDHIDGNKLNNRIENLRAATKSQNCMNQKISIRNTSGIKGVMWHKRDKKWVVALRVNSILHSFGYFKDKELAELVAVEATNKLHQEFSAYKGVLNGQ